MAYHNAAGDTLPTDERERRRVGEVAKKRGGNKDFGETETRGERSEDWVESGGEG